MFQSQNILLVSCLSTKLTLILHNHYKFKLCCVKSFQRRPPSEIFHFLKNNRSLPDIVVPEKSKTQHDINILFLIHWCQKLSLSSFSSFSTTFSLDGHRRLFLQIVRFTTWYRVCGVSGRITQGESGNVTQATVTPHSGL